MNGFSLKNAHTQLMAAALISAVAGQAQAQSTTLKADADTTLKELSPVTNFGAEAALRTQGLPRERTLVRFDQSKLAAVVGSRPVVSASLELTVQDVSWIWGNISAHRVSKAWTESGATWSCANDTTPSNFSNNCTSANAWSMTVGNGYVATASSTQRVTSGLTVAKFDVTADVKAFLSGSQVNNGWLLKVAIEGVPGTVRFRARESGAAPRLVLNLGGTTAPGQVGDPCTADAGCGGYANAVCFTEAEYGIPDGYCSAFCSDNSQCPSDSACIEGACALPCTNGTCDAGYYCFDDGRAQSCLPTCSSDADCTGGRQCVANLCNAPE